MATNTMIDKQDLVDAETIWEYMKLNHTVVKVALNALQHTYMYRASVHPHKMNPTVAIVKVTLNALQTLTCIELLSIHT